MRFLILILALLAQGCGSEVLAHARATYPDCVVEEIDDDLFLVTCPNREPFERRFRKAN